MIDKRTILIAGMGTSPAVLTETAKALCHQKNPTVPDEIVVLSLRGFSVASTMVDMCGSRI